MNFTQVVSKDAMALKVMPDTFLLNCFVSPKESTFETRKNAIYFTLKALSVFEIFKF